MDRATPVSHHPYRRPPLAPKIHWMPAWLQWLTWKRETIAWCAIVLVYGAAVIGTAIGTVGCSDPFRQVQIHTADSVAEAANAALPILVERYRQEGFRAIDAVKASGGNADDAKAAVEAVRAKWAPIWKAWETLSVAQDAWADALESGGDGGATVEALKEAYCGLRGVWPDDIPAVPLAPLRCPAAMDTGPSAGVEVPK
jgi:hypothetical protein